MRETETEIQMKKVRKGEDCVQEGQRQNVWERE